MASLTQVAITTRKVIRYSIFFIIFLIVGKLLLNLSIGLYNKLFPPAAPPPTVTYGKLPKLPFPSIAQLKVTLVQETAEGELPTFPESVKVYYMPKVTSNLLALDEAKAKASSMGFLPNEQKVSDSIYKFTTTNAAATLEMNIITGIFSISYDLKADPTPIQTKPQNPEVTTSLIKSYLSTANLMPSDLTGPTNYEYLKVEGDKFVPALALADASLVKIHLFRKSYDNYPSMTIDPTKANVWFLTSGATEKQKKIIAGEYHYFPVDESQNSTYPIKTSEIAWNELTSGGGYIASLGTNKEGDTIKIRKIYLAYFDPGVAIEFFQPIIVFEGDKGFVAYVPAVTADYYGK